MEKNLLTSVATRNTLAASGCSGSITTIRDISTLALALALGFQSSLKLPLKGRVTNARWVPIAFDDNAIDAQHHNTSEIARAREENYETTRLEYILS